MNCLSSCILKDCGVSTDTISFESLFHGDHFRFTVSLKENLLRTPWMMSEDRLELQQLMQMDVLLRTRRKIIWGIWHRVLTGQLRSLRLAEDFLRHVLDGMLKLTERALFPSISSGRKRLKLTEARLTRPADGSSNSRHDPLRSTEATFRLTPPCDMTCHLF